MTKRTTRIKLTGAIQIRIDEREASAMELLYAKGIRAIDVFRRGLDAYVTDLARNGDIQAQNSVEEKDLDKEG